MAFAPDSCTHHTSMGMCVPSYNFVTLQFLRKVPQKFIWWGWTEWCTEERNQVKNDRRKEWLKVRQIQYSPIVWKRGYNNIVFVICLLSRLIVLGFNNTSTLWVILCLFPEKGRKQIEEILEEKKERDKEEKGTGMKVKKQKNRNIPPLPLPATRIADLAQL